MKVIILNGSPKAKGNTEISAAASHATAAGKAADAPLMML